MKSIAFIYSFWFLKEKIWQSIFWNSGRGSPDLVMWILSSRRNSDLCLKCVQSKAFKFMKYQGWLGSAPFGESFLCWPIPEVKILICLTWFVLGVNYHCLYIFQKVQLWPLKCSVFCFVCSFTTTGCTQPAGEAIQYCDSLQYLWKTMQRRSFESSEQIFPY